MVDIDGLGTINSRWGRDTGNQVLRSVARILTSVFRVEDIVARVGDDEFAVLLPTTDVEGVSVAVERLRQSLSDDPVCAGDVRVGLSLGIATEPKRGDLQQALHVAGVRLYEDMAARGWLKLQTG
jgi:diguanylate cyclase (GGDEF)-like protein